MISLYEKSPIWREIVGENASHIVHEYLHKTTQNPVIHIYPTGEFDVFAPNKTLGNVALTQLTPESCADMIQVLSNIYKKCDEFQKKNQQKII